MRDDVLSFRQRDDFPNSDFWAARSAPYGASHETPALLRLLLSTSNLHAHVTRKSRIYQVRRQNQISVNGLEIYFQGFCEGEQADRKHRV